MINRYILNYIVKGKLDKKGFKRFFNNVDPANFENALNFMEYLQISSILVYL